MLCYYLCAHIVTKVKRCYQNIFSDRGYVTLHDVENMYIINVYIECPNEVLIKLPPLRFPNAHSPTLVFLTNVLIASFYTKYNGPLWLNL